MNNRIIYQWVNGWSKDELNYDMEVNTHDHEINYKEDAELLNQAVEKCIDDGFECDALQQIKLGIDLYQNVLKFIESHTNEACRLNVQWHWYYL